MGHVELKPPPRTREWLQVIEMIDRGEEVPAIAVETLNAVQKALELAGNDEGVAWSIWLLTRLPLAAREGQDYVSQLADLGITVEEAPTTAALLGRFSDAIDEHLRWTGHRTDYAEMAQMAAVETLKSVLSERSKTLWGTSPLDVRRALAGVGQDRQFGKFVREFFARLSRRFLTFFLSRELPNHIAGNRRFANLSHHAEFDDALRLHCQQSAFIVEKFARDWFSKHDFEQDFTPQAARGFSWKALDKLREEFRLQKAKLLAPVVS